MSATRDKNSKITFVYSNLHAAYRKGLDAARASGTPVGLSRGRIIKAYDQHREVKVERHTPPALLRSGRTAHTVSRPPVLKQQSEALQSLKDNLKSLTDLHSRLRFMLKELEDLVKN